MEKSQHVIPTITAGVVMGIVELLVLMSFATLIFSGDLAFFAGRGIGIFIVSGIVVMVITTLLSSIKGSFGSVQDVSSVVLALIAAHIVEQVGNPQAEETYYTILAAIAFNTLLTGVMFFLITQFKLTNIIRSFPYPVIGGLIAGSGWRLFIGGFDILTDGAPLADYLKSDVLLHWLPGFIFAVILLIFLRRISHYLLMPSLLVGSIILFYAVLLATGTDIAQAQTDGFLLGPFPSGGLLKPLTPAQWDKVQWELVFSESGHIATILAVSAITLVLNVSGIELALHEDVNIDREVKVAGLVNGINGLFGGGIGFQALSLTAMGRRIGANNRAYPLISALMAFIVLLSGPSILELFPKTILGGLIIFFGLSFLVDWLVDAYEHLPRLDYIMIIAIIIAVATIGYLEGVVIGLILALMSFAFDYSRVETIRHHFTGAEYHSTVQRSRVQNLILQTEGRAIEIYQLQGFIFFGTANALYNHIARLVNDVNYLILEFRQVNKLDSSAVYSLQKLHQLTTQNDIELIFAAVPEGIKGQVKQVPAKQYENLDSALAYAEEKILEDQPTGSGEVSLATLMQQIPHEDLAHLFKFMEKQHHQEGDVLAEQGTVADAMFFVSRGMLGVYLTVDNGPAYRIRTITEGSVVGEIGTYLDTVRTATIKAETDCEVLRFSREAMQKLAMENPNLAYRFHEQMSHLLAQRLVDTTQTLEAALR